MSYYVLGKLFGRDIFESIFLERLTNFSFANKRCLLFNLLPIFLFLVTSGSKELHAQYFLSNQDDSYLRPITFDEAAFNTLYDTIHARLAQPYGDTARTYVAESILQFCGEDCDCQINLHHRLRDSLFENSHYLIALELGRTSAQLALKNEDPYNVGLAYVDLSFYYHDLGRGDSMVALLERSLIHFEESGACYRQFKVRTELLERKHGRKPKEIVPLTVLLKKHHYQFRVVEIGGL